MLSQKVKYAIRALIALDELEPEDHLSIAEIATRARVPRKFLEQILLELKKRGLVRSVRGKHGGYALGRSAAEIPLADVIRIIDGPLALAPCASKTAYRTCQDCEDEATCPIRRVLIEVRDATAGILEQRSIAAMATYERRSRAQTRKR
jgi:Rrf2 family protein